jgi:hypothetical protein
MRQLALSLIRKGIKGDVYAATAIMDRALGKPVSRLEIEARSIDESTTMAAIEAQLERLQARQRLLLVDQEAIDVPSCESASVEPVDNLGDGAGI